MDTLREMIGSMEKEEIRAFKLFATRIDKSHQRKDLDLYDYVRSSGDAYNEEEIFKRLYEGKAKNTFHRLKSRLIREVNKSQVLLKVEQNDVLELHHLLSIVVIYREKKEWDLAFHFLRKAERKAKAGNRHDLLDIIYNEYILLSQALTDIDPEEYIRKRKDNYLILTRLREMDDVLATLDFRLRTTQNFSGKESSVIAMLEQIISEYGDEVAVRTNAPIRFRLFNVASRILLEKRDFVAMVEYVETTLNEFEEDGLFNRKTHSTRMQMLAYMVNSLYKVGKFRDSLVYADRLREAMDQYEGQFREDYLFFYYNSLVINYFRLDVDKAIEVLEKMRAEDQLMEDAFSEFFVHMNLAISWYMKQDFRKSIRWLVRAYILKGYEAAAPEFKLKIAVAELMIRYHLEEYDVIISRVRQVKREFGELLKEKGWVREKMLIALLSKMNETLDVHLNKRLLKRAEKFLNTGLPEDREEELIDYNDFIQEAFRVR